MSGWDASADAWIASIGEDGDWGRRCVLDAPMRERVQTSGARDAIDVGCGEGRFCRMMRQLGIAAVGIDPTQAFIERARTLDPSGDYRLCRAEQIDARDASFDLAVSYLTLIDIDDLRRAFAEIDRVLRPGGTLLVANLATFNTAGDHGWRTDASGERIFAIDNYLIERPIVSEWHGISVVNWHRPFSAYCTPLFERGYVMTHFADPEPTGDDAERIARYRRVPFFTIFEWRKPAASARLE